MIVFECGIHWKKKVVADGRGCGIVEDKSQLQSLEAVIGTMADGKIPFTDLFYYESKQPESGTKFK